MGLSYNDFIGHLIEQFDHLLTSIKAFDQDEKLNEAKRMATTVRVLVHDTNKSISLLTHLNKKSILFCDSSVQPKQKLPDGTIIIKPMTKPMYYEEFDLNGPKLYSNLDSNVQNESFIPFNDWWENQTILTSGVGDDFTRKSLVLSLSNQDGGAHVDNKLKKDYSELTRGGSTGETFQIGNNQPEPIKNPHLYTMRQIAYEIRKTLAQEFTHLSEN
ncbi:hypothetical protein [Guptibacillus spartinae]|uniref:hypothetical protein n=1 Tax=Guptibacillus spartinae TaxID=3025679 RepID=UPI00235F161E|nr:hypothetical protein [Pseudalkalibacillus spartinae]